MTRGKRTATNAADNRQSSPEKEEEQAERRSAARGQRAIEVDLERRMRRALIDVRRALAGEDEECGRDYREVELASDLIH